MASVQDIIRDAQVALQDVEGTRWPAAELVTYLHDGRLALLNVQPAEASVVVVFTPTDGARQNLPPDAMSLLDVVSNYEGRRRLMTPVVFADLGAASPNWFNQRPAVDLIHWMVLPSEPDHFYVYPPASTDARLELTYCRYPSAMPVPGTPVWTSASGDTGLEAKWSPALLDYVLYRAWSKDAEAGANAQLAASHLSTFIAQIGATAS